MLYLTRKVGESVVINGHIRVTLVETKGRGVKLLFEYPDGTTVLRKEVYDRICEENRLAALSSHLIQEALT